jgi:hypothetical protein
MRTLANSYAVLLSALACVAVSSTAWAEAAKEEAKAQPAEAAPQAGLVPGPGADIICEADIFFSWKLSPPKEKENAANNTQAAPENDDDSEAVKEFFSSAGEEGLVEEEVRNRLSAKLPQMQQEAMKFCVSAHQDQTGCISSKIRLNADQYSRLDFVARKAMIDAINNDCEQSLGKCLSTETGEMKCRINRPPDVPAQAAASADEKSTEKSKDTKKK